MTLFTSVDDAIRPVYFEAHLSIKRDIVKGHIQLKAFSIDFFINYSMNQYKLKMVKIPLNAQKGLKSKQSELSSFIFFML